MREIDLGWDAGETASAESPARAAGGARAENAVPELRVIRAEPGRSDDKLPLPGLPPVPDPRAVLASRILRRATPGSIAARMATSVMETASRPADAPPAASPSRRAGALPTPARQHVAFAVRRRHGAAWHVGGNRRPTHAEVANIQPRRLGTPPPMVDHTGHDADDPETYKIKPSFWQRVLLLRK